MSIGAAVTSFEHDGRKVNLIDTPGEPSFVADTLAALRVVDAAVFVVNGVMGVEVHTDRLWRRADEEGLARLVFVNMLDRERADFFRCLESLKAAFGQHVVATEIPIGSEHEVRGVDRPDRHEGVRVRRATAAATRQQIEIPEELVAQAEEYREKLMDEVAENSDELMERYLEGEEISHDEIVAALKQGVTEGHLFPVTCGVATQNLGTNRLLEALVEDLPVARDARRGRARSTPRASRSRSSPTRTASCSPTSSRPSPTRTRAASTCSASTRACCRRDSQVARTSPSAQKERIGQLSAPRGQGDDADRRARPGRHRRGREAARDPRRRRAGGEGHAGLASRRSTCRRR